MLVICPTRELATQAANEANKLLKYHPTIGVQVVIGGTRLTMEQKKLQANPCQVIRYITDDVKISNLINMILFYPIQ